MSLKYLGSIFQVSGSRLSIGVRSASCYGVSRYLIQRYKACPSESGTDKFIQMFI